MSERTGLGPAVWGALAALAIVAAGLAGWTLLREPEPPVPVASTPTAAVPMPAPSPAAVPAADPAPEPVAAAPADEAAIPDPQPVPDAEAAEAAAENAAPSAPETAGAGPSERESAPDAAGTAAAAAVEIAPDAPDESAPTFPGDAVALEPSFDIVRIAPDGAALVAGTATAGQTVELLLDGAVIGTAEVDAGGRFVLLFDLPPSDAGRVLELASRNALGGRDVAGASVLVSPFAAPLTVAEAAPTPLASDNGIGATDSDAGPARIGASDGGATDRAVAAASDPPEIIPAGGTDQPAAEPATPACAAAPDPAAGLQPAAAATGTEPRSLPAEPPAVASTAEALPPAADRIAAAPPGVAPAPVAQAVAPAAPDPGVAGSAPAAPPVPPSGALAPEAAALPEPARLRPVPRPARIDPVPGAAPPAVLVGAQGVRVLQSGVSPTAPPLARIDAIAYTDTGAVEVSGRAGAGAEVRLYLDNRLTLSTSADASGHWRAELPSVEPGLYRLRADQLDATGRVTGRAETPFLRESPAALAAARPAEDAAGARVVTVQPGFTLWGIARRTYGRGILYVQVFDANRDQIRNPDLIYPGQVFSLPEIE
ncbi:MAG: LysM peptidoglycan-binding domain-containing protein [Gemmobacter sp.]